MLKIIKKLFIGSLSLIGMSIALWTILLVNPSLSYAHETQFDQVTVFHNEPLEKEAETIIKNALELIKEADIYDKKLNIQLCLNDDSIYPHLHPIPGGSAYAFMNKAVIYASEPRWEKNISEMRWEANNYELRSYNLTALLAHEFTHNLQYKADPKLFIKETFGKIFWIFEGQADYISRGFRNDGLLKEKLEYYLKEKDKDFTGLPTFTLEDGTIQVPSYYKYALVYQYLSEEKNLSFEEICKLDHNIDVHYSELLEWSNL